MSLNIGIHIRAAGVAYFLFGCSDWYILDIAYGRGLFRTPENWSVLNSSSPCTDINICTCYLFTYTHTYMTTKASGCVCVCLRMVAWKLFSLLAPHLNYICARLCVCVCEYFRNRCLLVWQNTKNISSMWHGMPAVASNNRGAGISARSQALSHTASPHTHAWNNSLQRNATQGNATQRNAPHRIAPRRESSF